MRLSMDRSLPNPLHRKTLSSLYFTFLEFINLNTLLYYLISFIYYSIYLLYDGSRTRRVLLLCP